MGSSRVHFDWTPHQTYRDHHPMRKYLELLVYEIYCSVPGQDPQPLQKPVQECLAISISSSQLQSRISTKGDRANTRQYLAYRIMWGLHPDVRLMLFDYLADYGYPDTLELAYDAIAPGAYQIGQNVMQRRVVETLALIPESPEAIRHKLMRVEGVRLPTPEEIEQYLYFFWNVRGNMAEDPDDNDEFLRRRLRTLQNEVEMSNTVRTPYWLPPGEVSSAEPENYSQTWQEFSQDDRLRPLETYYYSQRLLAGEAGYQELIAGLGIPDTEEEDIGEVLRECFNMLVRKYRYNLSRGWQVEADQYVYSIRELGKVMRWFNIQPSTKRKTLGNRYEIKTKTGADYGLPDPSGGKPADFEVLPTEERDREAEHKPEEPDDD